MRSAVTVSLPRELLERVDERAGERSRSEVVREALEAWLAGGSPRLGSMAGSVRVVGDLVAPTGERWDAEE
jgi:metal-responsive CopG/Arc/MetJ family transcriptional regulator